MPSDKIHDVSRHLAQLQVAAPTHLLRNFGRNIARPAFQYVEAEDADRVGIFAGQQLLDDGFEIGMLNLGFAPDAAEPAETR